MVTQVIVSVIIVYYHVQKELFDCIESIVVSNPKTPYEIIVVDNDEEKTVKKALIETFPFVSYITSPGNVGFGAGNNIGAKKAHGRFLFFLNPDTFMQKKTIDVLIDFLLMHTDTGIVAPLVLDKNKKMYDVQGTMELNPFSALFALTFMNKYFPDNPVSQRYFLHGWDRKNARNVDVVPGSAFVVRKDVFKRIGGFDEQLFLYFEEADLCRRVKKLGFTIYLLPKASVTHLSGKSTVQNKQTKHTFERSRFYYFRKFFGLLPACFVHIMTSISNPLKNRL